MGAPGTKRVGSDNAPVRESKRVKATKANGVPESGTAELLEEHIDGESAKKVLGTERKQVDKVAVTKVAEEDGEEEEEEVEITVKQTKRKQTIKKAKEEEAEMKPLALRTQGLRMFIGAHVSASKGVYSFGTNA